LVWAAGGIAAVAFLAFAHTLPYRFVFDDEGQILRNPWLRDWSRIGTLLTTDVWRFANPADVSNYYRPLHMLLYMAAHALFGPEPWGYHLTSILLHALCSVLVGAVGLRLTGSPAAALGGALLFAVHPVHGESVAWVAAVTDPLCAAFYFAALHVHLGERPESGRSFAPVTGALLFLGALLSKEMALTFPIVALWADAALGRRPRWRSHAGYAAACALYAALRVHALGRFLIPQVSVELDAVSRMLSTAALAGKYALEMFVPYDIRPYYVFTPTRSPASAEFLLGAAALAALAALALRRRRAVGFLGGYCLITLVPLLSLSYGWESLFQVRYLYIPSLGACLLAAMAARALWLRLPLPAAWSRPRVAAALGVLPLGACLAGLWSTTWMWRDNRTFYSETVRRAPASMLMSNNLGRHYLTEGDYARAEECYRRSLALFDGALLKREVHRSKAYEGLGMIAFKRRDLEGARTLFDKAFQSTPDSIDALMSLGMVHGATGDFTSALAYYRRALERNPQSEVIHNNVAGALLASGQPDAAIAEARRALEIYPRLAESYLIIGRAYADKGLREQARAAYLTARAVDPNTARLVEEQLRLLD
jgi:tetratricopeptide (TPR) repeat protein